MRRLASALLAVSFIGALPGSGQPPKLAGFSFAMQSDLSGYYFPDAAVTTGAYKLLYIGISAPDDFAKHRAGERWNGHFAPIMLVFAPRDARQMQGAEGGTYWEGSFRVLPSAYRVADSKIAFAGTHAKLGAVSFTGTIDTRAVGQARQGSVSDTGKVVMTGDLVVGGRRFPGLKFTWFGGD